MALPIGADRGRADARDARRGALRRARAGASRARLRGRAPALVPAAAELDHLTAAGGPGRDAAVEHRAGVDALRGQDRRGDAGPGAALADRHDRSIGGHVRRRRPGAGDRGCCGCRRCSRRRARRARARRSARRPPRAGASSSSRLDRLDPLGAATEHVAVEVEEADGAQAADRALGLGGARGLDDDPARRGRARSRPSSRTSCPRPARSARRARDRRGSRRPARTSSTVASGGARQLARPRLRCADERAAVELDERGHVRRLRGADGRRVGDERRARRSIWSAGLKRRSKPIVDDAFELIALPQSEPATWPGKTSTPSGSSSSRRSEWKRPFGALASRRPRDRAGRRRRRRASRR